MRQSRLKTELWCDCIASVRWSQCNWDLPGKGIQDALRQMAFPPGSTLAIPGRWIGKVSKQD